MALGLAYDSDEGRAMDGAVSALLTGTVYATSAEMAGELGAFAGFEKNRGAMLRVIRNHRKIDVGAVGDIEGHGRRPGPGTTPWRQARNTAFATPKRPSSRRPAPSAW